ncbi:MAG: hypothetical protein WCT85_02395 [Parachlamydiales bacterium]|jgi:FtsH-binding integral membrane protein
MSSVTNNHIEISINPTINGLDKKTAEVKKNDAINKSEKKRTQLPNFYKAMWSLMAVSALVFGVGCYLKTSDHAKTALIGRTLYWGGLLSSVFFIAAGGLYLCFSSDNSISKQNQHQIKEDAVMLKV